MAMLDLHALLAGIGTGHPTQKKNVRQKKCRCKNVVQSCGDSTMTVMSSFRDVMQIRVATFPLENSTAILVPSALLVKVIWRIVFDDSAFGWQ